MVREASMHDVLEAAIKRGAAGTASRTTVLCVLRAACCLRRMGRSGATEWAKRCPQTLAFAVLLYYFRRASRPPR